MSKLTRRWANAARVRVSDRIEILSLYMAIVFVRIALSCVGYNRFRKIIPSAQTLPPVNLLNKLGRRVTRLARFVPGASCLTQAVAAQLVLARLGYQSDMRVGVRQDETGQIRAHAWLLSVDKVILGGHPTELQTFSPLVDFSPRSS